MTVLLPVQKASSLTEALQLCINEPQCTAVVRAALRVWVDGWRLLGGEGVGAPGAGRACAAAPFSQHTRNTHTHTRQPPHLHTHPPTHHQAHNRMTGFTFVCRGHYKDADTVSGDGGQWVSAVRKGCR